MEFTTAKRGNQIDACPTPGENRHSQSSDMSALQINSLWNRGSISIHQRRRAQTVGEVAETSGSMRIDIYSQVIHRRWGSFPPCDLRVIFRSNPQDNLRRMRRHFF